LTSSSLALLGLDRILHGVLELTDLFVSSGVGPIFYNSQAVGVL
jgi:hypothetical protein